MPRRLTDRARLVAGYLRGQSARVPGPGALMIETTVRCNLQCPMCPRTGADYPNAQLPDELLWPLLEEHARLGGDHVYLYGLGEPMLDRRIFDLLRRCKSLGLGTVLSSNATLLNAERRSKLLDAGCDHLLIGLDGVTQETYGYYRAPGKLSKVEAHVEALAAEKLKRKSHMTIVVQFIRMRRNWHEQQAFLERWRPVAGVDMVRIKDEDIGLPEHRTFEPDELVGKNPCHILWRGPLIVRHTGDVYTCYHIAEEGEPLGNLADMSLEALWDSERMRQLRELHVTGRGAEDPYCAGCPCARPRLPFVLGAMALRGTTVRRLVPLAERVALRFPALFHEPRRPTGGHPGAGDG